MWLSLISFFLSVFTEDYFYFTEEGKKIHFDLLDPGLAPKEIRDDVMKGYDILMNTRKNAPDFVGNALSCTNCHFFAGNTVEGKNGGISLVGVVNVYPKYLSRSKRVVSLKKRIQDCFEKSMNGTAPAEDSKVMEEIICYLTWIAWELKDVKEVPWLGLQPLSMKKEPDIQKGQKVYEECCLSCHRAGGEGTEGVPPIYGYGSFNKRAGMAQLPILASFIYWNMPYQEAPQISEEEAIDVASYVLSKPRGD